MATEAARQKYPDIPGATALWSEVIESFRKVYDEGRVDGLREAAAKTEAEAPDEPYAGATFGAHARWLRAEADHIEEEARG